MSGAVIETFVGNPATSEPSLMSEGAKETMPLASYPEVMWWIHVSADIGTVEGVEPFFEFFVFVEQLTNIQQDECPANLHFGVYA